MGDLGGDSCLRFRFVGGGGGAGTQQLERTSGRSPRECSIVHRRKNSPGSTCRMVAKGEIIRIPLGQPNLGACASVKVHRSNDRGETVYRFND